MKKIDLNKLKDLYINKEYNQKELASYFKVSVDTVRDRLIKLKILRSNKTQRTRRKIREARLKKYQVSTEKLLLDLQKMKDLLGRAPTYSDFYKLQNLLDISYPSTYRRRFGSLNDALKKVGIDPLNYHLNQKFTKSQVIKRFKKLCDHLGRLPTQQEILKDPKLPNSIETIYKFLGHQENWTKIFKYKAKKKHGFGNVYQALDGHICDSYGELLIDNWFYTHNIHHIKEVKYPFSNKLIADWRVYDYYIEYVGLYRGKKTLPSYLQSLKSKRKMCKQHKLKLVEIYPENLNNLDTILKRFLKVPIDNYITWRRFEFDISVLINSISRNNYDYIVAIAAGGLIPGICISKKLDIPLVSLLIQSYNKDRKQFPIKIKDSSIKDIQRISGNILVVDDLIDTSHTIKKCLELLRKNKNIKHIQTAVLYKKRNSLFNPDFYVKNLTGWVVFPWE